MFCPQPKDNQITVTEEERNQKIFAFKNMESENFEALHCGECRRQVMTRKKNVWDKKDDVSGSAASHFSYLQHMF